jgi:hypothetical protein
VARILWRDAQGVEGSIDLSATEVKIGRATDCEIRTDDAMVSRHHARLVWGGGGYVIEDLGSANGLYFQEQRVGNHLFKHGDALRCGSLWLRYVESESPGGAMGPSPNGEPNPSALPNVPLAPLPSTERPKRSTVEAFGNPATRDQGPASLGEADVEIRNLRRRLEQLQTELRVYRTNKFSMDTARKMEDVENDLSVVEIERDQLKVRLTKAEETIATEAGSIKVKRALEIASMASETSASLHDLLSSLRIEVMAAEGEFEQYSANIPRSSFELIRESLRQAAGHCDEAREELRKLRDIT